MSTTPTPLIVVISGPSGVGKDTLIERMAALGHDLHFTITATTRLPRPGEKEGVNHYFVTKDEFFNMVAKQELLEWAQVYGNYYGVPKQQVRAALKKGRHVIIRVDVQGARRIRQLVPEALFIFVVPPSLDILRGHLIRRGVNSSEDIERRLSAAKLEIAEADAFDYKVLNEEDRLDDTVAEVATIIDRESRRNPPRKIEV
jgi:guanylate kinase